MSTDAIITEGSRVELELISRSDTREELEFTLVPDRAADFDRGLLGSTTPLGQAILGHAAGETLEYARGDIVQVRILRVAAGDAGGAPEDAGETRADALRRARDKAELANLVSFALTVDSKWGDYDPEHIVQQYEEQDKKEEP